MNLFQVIFGQAPDKQRTFGDWHNPSFGFTVKGKSSDVNLHHDQVHERADAQQGSFSPAWFQEYVKNTKWGRTLRISRDEETLTAPDNLLIRAWWLCGVWRCPGGGGGDLEHHVRQWWLSIQLMAAFTFWYCWKARVCELRATPIACDCKIPCAFVLAQNTFLKPLAWFLIVVLVFLNPCGFLVGPLRFLFGPCVF